VPKQVGEVLVHPIGAGVLSTDSGGDNTLFPGASRLHCRAGWVRSGAVQPLCSSQPSQS